MSSTAGIPRAEITGPYGYLLKRFSLKMLGEVPESLGVMWHNRAVLSSVMAFGRKAEKWNQLDPNLKSFAHMAVASLVGCSACLDFGYLQAHNKGLDEAKASEVPRWRESAVFNSLERDVMAYAEVVSQTPPRVTDALSARLLERSVRSPCWSSRTGYRPGRRAHTDVRGQQPDEKEKTLRPTDRPTC